MITTEAGLHADEVQYGNLVLSILGSQLPRRSKEPKE